MYAAGHAETHPDQPALIMAGSGEVITYRRYEERANRVAHLLRNQGLRRGDHIAVLMENCAEMLIIEGAAERSGLYYTLINSYLAPAEVAYIVDDCGARVLFTSVARAGVAMEAATACPHLELRLLVGAADGDDAVLAAGWEPYGSAVSGLSTGPIADERLGAALLYSSGTTGRPKGILRPVPDVPPSEVLPVMEFVRNMCGYRPGMTYLSPAPLYHSAPQSSVSGAIRSGSTAVIMEHFDAEAWCALVERHRVTHSQMVPTMFNRLLRLPDEVRARYDVSSLEQIVHAAAPCPVPIKAAMMDWVGPIIREYYGATEANGFTLALADEWLARPGTVGRAILGELAILDDDGAPCPTGVDGTVWFGGATNFEYLGDPAKTAAAKSADGRASTVGDVGHVDGEGWLYLTDRKSYMIISGGVNIYPQETENLLSTHPAVIDVAVIGVPDDDLGEVVKAVVQVVPGVATGPDLEAELIAFCRAGLAHFKSPRSIDFTDELPRLPTGKLYKRILKDRYLQEHRDRRAATTG